MYRPNYINTTPIQLVDATAPYTDGLILTSANHQQDISTSSAKRYYSMTEQVYPQSISVNGWMQLDHLSGGHLVLLGATLQSPEMDAGGDFTTAYLRQLSFSGLLHTNTTSVVDDLHLFTWTGIASSTPPNNAGYKAVSNYTILSSGGRRCSCNDSFVLTSDNFAFDSSFDFSIPHVVACGYGIYNPTATQADAVQCRFSMTASQHLHERPVFDPSR